MGKIFLLRDQKKTVSRESCLPTMSSAHLDSASSCVNNILSHVDDDTSLPVNNVSSHIDNASSRDVNDIDDSLLDDFQVYQLDESEAISIQENEYIQDIVNWSYLSLLHRNHAHRAFVTNKGKRLFFLFLCPSLWAAVLHWTNLYYHKKGKRRLTTMAKLEAYIGLELAMSIVKIGNVKSYWGKARFTGHSDFHDTMSRDDFQNICASIQFHPPLCECKKKH